MNGFQRKVNSMNALINIPLTIYVDMDGTLAEYKEVEVKALYEPLYFVNLLPNENVIEGLRTFSSKHPDVSIQVLSCILSDRPNAIDEKMSWIRANCPFLLKTAPCFIPCGENKGSIVKNDGIHILLDDHSPNLLEFCMQENCYGIKLLNGINGAGKKWQGPAISKELDPNSFADELYRLLPIKEIA